MIVIVDYGVGNLASVERMLKKAGVDAKLSDNPEEILAADKIILPGVGNFGHCSQSFRESGCFDAVNDFALTLKRPVLGICVGAQMLGSGSEEAPGAAGLGWIEMHCVKFRADMALRVPNMGWSHIAPRNDSPLFAEHSEESRYYFVHSYHFVVEDQSHVIATTEYGIEYACAVQKNNIFGVQFHPEKSLRHGLALMRTFAKL